MTYTPPFNRLIQLLCVFVGNMCIRWHNKHRILMTSQYKTKVAMSDPYINSDCYEIFLETICQQKATVQEFPAH